MDIQTAGTGHKEAGNLRTEPIIDCPGNTGPIDGIINKPIAKNPSP